MAFGKDHELHERRFSRNLWVGLLLAGFVALIFGLTFVKVTRQAPDGGFAVPGPAGAMSGSVSGSTAGTSVAPPREAGQ